jgi:hypothetical protein
LSEPLSDDKLRSYLDVPPKIHEPWSAHLVDQLLETVRSLQADRARLVSRNAELGQALKPARLLAEWFVGYEKQNPDAPDSEGYPSCLACGVYGEKGAPLASIVHAPDCNANAVLLLASPVEPQP